MHAHIFHGKLIVGITKKCTLFRRNKPRYALNFPTARLIQN